MNEAVESVLAVLDGFRMSDEITYSAYSALYDEISLLDDLLKEQEPIEPKTGKWITRLRHEHYPSGKPYEEDFCSECGKRGSLEYPFCPWCGIKMESGEVG